MEEIVELAKKINEYDPEDYDPSEPPICLQCGGEYRMETGEEPTALCDACAHAAAQAFAEIIEQRIKASKRQRITTVRVCADCREPGHGSNECPHWPDCDKVCTDGADCNCERGFDK